MAEIRGTIAYGETRTLDFIKEEGVETVDTGRHRGQVALCTLSHRFRTASSARRFCEV